MRRTISEMLEEGCEWEEAEERLWAIAEQEADAERDRQLEEKLNQGDHK